MQATQNIKESVQKLAQKSNFSTELYLVLNPSIADLKLIFVIGHEEAGVVMSILL